MGKLRLNGHFWLPSRPDHRVAGILEFSRRHGGKLNLLGSFDTLGIGKRQSVVIGTRRTEEVRILGVTDKTLLTLEGCLCNSETVGVVGTQAGMPTAEYTVGTIFVGCHLDADQKLLVKAVQVRICNLEDWVGASHVSQNIQRDDSTRGVRRLELACTLPEPLVATFDALSLDLSYSYRMVHERPSTWCLHEQCRLAALFQEYLTLSEVFDTCGALCTIVSIGVDSPSPITQLRVRMAKSAADRDPGQGQWVDIHADTLAMRRKCGGRSPRHHDMLFCFDDVGGLDGLSNWITQDSRFRAVLGEILSYWHVRKPYVGNRIVGLSIGAEILYRKKRPLHRGRLSITRVFKELVQDSQPFFGSVVGDTESWVKDVTRMRHGAAHGELAGDDERLYALCESVYLLIVLNLLDELDAPAAVLRKVVQHSRWHNVSVRIG